MTLAEELTKKWAHLVLPENRTPEIPSWTEPHCLAYCCEVASKSEFGVELGTYMGGSASVMLQANPKLHLWCVDIFEVFGVQEVAEKMFLKQYIKEGRCEIIKGDSARAAVMLKHMAGRLDFCWVDDGHATEDVLRDIRSFLPLIKGGGEIFGHDFDVPHNDVALGVIGSGIPYTIPVPRLWSHTRGPAVVGLLANHGGNYFEPMIFCDGCKCGHHFPCNAANPEGHRWNWNGDVVKPTMTPSMLIDKGGPSTCHTNVNDGIITFHGDCFHELKNTSRPLHPFTEW